MYQSSFIEGFERKEKRKKKEQNSIYVVVAVVNWRVDNFIIVR